MPFMLFMSFYTEFLFELKELLFSGLDLICLTCSRPTALFSMYSEGKWAMLSNYTGDSNIKMCQYPQIQFAGQLWLNSPQMCTSSSIHSCILERCIVPQYGLQSRSHMLQPLYFIVYGVFEIMYVILFSSYMTIWKCSNFVYILFQKNSDLSQCCQTCISVSDK